MIGNGDCVINALELIGILTPDEAFAERLFGGNNNGRSDKFIFDKLSNINNQKNYDFRCFDKIAVCENSCL